ncbi:hypothetical protein C8R47DRAFT_1320583 [Mycena vitilis]|nr:hypothetical protein C8R47DRAFT_1320583 [Mycena vitilis]
MSESIVLDSLILLLPPEITAAIFEHCLPSDHPWPASGQDRSSDQPWPSSDKAPLLLGQICRQWRDISLDTPTLWESIAFGDTMSIDLLKVWLSRARSRPLYLYFTSVNDARADVVMQAATPYCAQWQDVYLFLPIFAYRYLDMAVFPRLERLIFLANGGTGGFSILEAPLLREAEIRHLPQFRSQLPLQQLTSLKFKALADIAETIAVLQCCPNLLKFSCGSTSIGVDVPLAPLELPLLRSLELADETMIRCLTLPRLSQLKMSYTRRNIDVAVDDIQALMSRSSCELRSFAISLYSPTVVQCQRLFRAVESINHLQLFFQYSTDYGPQIQALAGPVDALPHLEHLAIRDHAEGDYYRQLLDLLRWRRRDRSLQSFELLLGTKRLGSAVARVPSDAVMDEFRALAEEGLQLQIMTWRKGTTTPTILIDTFPSGPLLL